MPTGERITEAMHALGVHMTEQGRGDEPLDLTSDEARAALIELGFADVERVL